MAEVSANYVKSVLATLPVGYYLGTRAEVTFSETASTSYCLPLANQIVVSYNNVKEAMSEISENDPAKIEEFTRGCLYHEVSHLILTPKFPNSVSRNIVEDERIETRLRKYYRDVNFREMVLKVNHWTPNWKPETVESFFFGIMRFHIGPEDLVKEGMSLVRKYMHLDANFNGYYDYLTDIEHFYDKCSRRFKDEAAANNQPSKSGNGNSKDDSGSQGASGKAGNEDGNEPEAGEEDGGSSFDSGDNEASSPSSTHEDGEAEDEAGDEEGVDGGLGDEDDSKDGNGGDAADDSEAEDKESSLGGATPAGVGGDGMGENSADNAKEGTSGNESDDDGLKKIAEEMDAEADKEYGEVPVITTDEVHDIVKKIMTAYNDQKIMAELHRVIIRSCKKRANRAGSATGYTGKVDPRLVGMRRDYRWFVRSGNDNNKFDRVHLTLWVDCSGSFSGDILEVNKLIASLNAVEKMIPGMFSFDVVSMNANNREHDKKVACEACGGNRFGPDIVKLSKKLNKSGWTNYNVAVWDGDMCSNMYGRAEEKVKNWLPAYRVFDNSKSIIVTDVSNRKYLDKACKNARLTYITDDYAEKFVGEVLKLLDRML